MDTKSLIQHAHNVRLGIVESVYAAGSGHPGGALGITDVLTYLYFQEMKVDPANPTMPERDRFVLSAAHMVPGLYSVLAERGYFPKSELKDLRKFGSRLKGHTFRNLEIGVETTGGSLGQGMSVAVGFALAAIQKSSNNRTYCIIGDGESNEGQIWEAAMFAHKYKLDNLCVIQDRNHIQLSDSTEVVMPLEPLADKWRAFGWNVYEIDAHDFDQIAFAFAKARESKGKPTLILANTTPGKGVSFMENKSDWHGKAPNEVDYKIAIQELTSNAKK